MATTESYIVDQELDLTREMHLDPIIPELVRAAGFIEHPPADVLLLAMLTISCGRYGGSWKVNACVNHNVVGSIWCKPGTERGSVLSITDTWIRASEHITFVPGHIQEVPPPTPDQSPFSVYGVVLVRSDRAL